VYIVCIGYLAPITYFSVATQPHRTYSDYVISETGISTVVQACAVTQCDCWYTIIHIYHLQWILLHHSNSVYLVTSTVWNGW